MTKKGVLLNSNNEVVAVAFSNLPAGDCEYSTETSYDALLQYDILVHKTYGKLSYSKANLKRAEKCDRFASVFDEERREFLLDKAE